CVVATAPKVPRISGRVVNVGCIGFPRVVGSGDYPHRLKPESALGDATPCSARNWTRLAFRYLMRPSRKELHMTWSIIARDLDSGAYGVAVASKFFAVGAICPHGEGGIGALSTQSLPNPLWGYRGMRLLREGMGAQDVIDHLVKPDEGAELRQFHIHDAKGGIAAYTGPRCVEWCGHVVRPGLSVAGNMLAGPDVVSATAHAFETSKEKSFTRRLIAAMKAGEAVGGDKRGK